MQFGGGRSDSFLPRVHGEGTSFPVCYDAARGLNNGSEDNGMSHVRGAPNHPQNQGKIERWHQTLKNRILLETIT